MKGKVNPKPRLAKKSFGLTKSEGKEERKQASATNAPGIGVSKTRRAPAITVSCE
jgi:hypothetical protein